MALFKIVHSLNEIHLDEKWKNSIEKLKSGSEPSYLNEKGKVDPPIYFGKKYELISIRERQLAGTEWLGRKFLFILAMVCTLGLAYFSKTVSKLYHKTTQTYRIGLYPKTDLKPSNIPVPTDTSSSIENKKSEPEQDSKKQQEIVKNHWQKYSEKLAVEKKPSNEKSKKTIKKPLPAFITPTICNQVPTDPLSLIPLTEIAQVKVENLLPHEIKALLCSKKRVEALTPNQVNACVLKMDKEAFHYLSDEQILKLDLSNFDKKIFNSIFPIISVRTSKLLQAYSMERIYKICHFFEVNHWKLISDEQIFKLNFSIIDKTIFNALFDPFSLRTNDRLQKYPLDRIYEIIQYFNFKHWQALSDEQILNLDYSKIDKTISVSLFSPYADRTKILFSKISDPQLIALKEYIGTDLHKFLSQKQKDLLK